MITQEVLLDGFQELSVCALGPSTGKLASAAPETRGGDQVVREPVTGMTVVGVCMPDTEMRRRCRADKATRVGLRHVKNWASPLDLLVFWEIPAAVVPRKVAR
ncbi:MAG: hypothetical protein ACRYG2_08915 [Janthinobacterium lividum]